MPTEEMFNRYTVAKEEAGGILASLGLDDEYAAATAYLDAAASKVGDSVSAAEATVAAAYDQGVAVIKAAADLPAEAAQAALDQLAAAKAAALKVADQGADLLGASADALVAAGKEAAKGAARQVGIGLGVGVGLLALFGLGAWYATRNTDSEKAARLIGTGVGAAAGNPGAALGLAELAR